MRSDRLFALTGPRIAILATFDSTRKADNPVRPWVNPPDKTLCTYYVVKTNGEGEGVPSGEPELEASSDGHILRAPSFTAAQKINGGAKFEQRIRGRLDSVHTRNRIEDDTFLLHKAVFENTC